MTRVAHKPNQSFIIKCELLVSLEPQFLNTLSKQFLTALQLIDAYVHVTNRRHAVLSR